MQPTTTVNNRYVVSGPLGGGGMAQVFLARDGLLERDVALKVLRDQYAENEEFVERFRREALNVASLSHPNIVQVYDRGTSEDGRYYMAMEYVPGGTLKDRIVRDGPLPAGTASAVAVQIADALGAAHERGVIHRDVKPQNVLVGASGDVKVADFGIARAAVADVISETSVVLGTARYMSPEQAMGQEAGPPSDLYSLGIVLYEMLTGEVPFVADTPVAISMKQVHEPPRPPGELRGGIPDALNAVVLKLLEKDPGARYASAVDLVADMHRAANGIFPVVGTGGEAPTEPFRPAPVSDGRDANTRGRRRWLLPILLPLAILATLGAVGWGLLGAPGAGEILGSLEGAPDRAREGAGELKEAVNPAARVEVPDVEDLDEAAARERLDDAGLGVAIRDRRSDEEATGQVLEQSVPAGKKVEEGSRILLAVSSGPGDQQGSAPDPASDDGQENPGDTDEPGGSGGAPDSGNYGGSPSNAAASPEPTPGVSSYTGQQANEAPPAPTGPSSQETPASAPSSAGPSSPEPASPAPSSPEPASPEPASPEPASPGPSSPGPSSPGPSSPEPSSPGPSSPEPASPDAASPGPSEPGGSAEPSSPGPASVGTDPAGSPSPEDE